MPNSKPIKNFIKRCLQHVAVKIGRYTLSRHEPVLIVLMYHRILPFDDTRAHIEEPGMIVAPETLRLHLEIIEKEFEIMQLSEWVKQKNDGSILPARACAITFDDGWADNYEFAFPILKDMGIPASIFLTSDMIGTRKMFWPERLSRIVREIALHHYQHWSHRNLEWIQAADTSYQFDSSVPSTEELSELIASAKTLADNEIHSRLDVIEKDLKLSLPDSAHSLLNWDQISDMIDSGIIEVGSHTCHHIRLNSTTPPEVLEKEIISSKQQIEHKTGQEVTTFCFPNGDYSSSALALVRQYYNCALTTKPGFNTIDNDNYLLQRFGIHQGNSKDRTAFLARISGLI